MTEIDEAWQRYRQGNFEQAARLFGNLPTGQGVVGRALSLVAMGQPEAATTLAEQQVEQAGTPDQQALLADVLGRQGRRQDAERILSRLTTRGDDGFYRTLLGEQRIRLGRWDDGTDEFVAGLNTGDRRAVVHLQKVVTDMVDAVAANRIPPEDALRFINRVDYSTSQTDQQLNRFFARARRALNKSSRMRREERLEPWAPQPGSDTGKSKPSKPKSAASAPSRSRPPAASPKSAPPEPPPQTGSRSSKQRSSNKPGGPMQARLAERPDQDGTQDQEAAIAAKRKDMTAVMEDERQRNEQLQDLVARVEPPIWPSKYATAIDTIEPIGFSTRSLLRGSNAIETSNFRVTGGDISVEIGLERCMNNLLAAAMAGNATTLPKTLDSIPRIELNLVDEFVEQMPQLEDMYREQMEIDRPDVMGLGRFIGECIVQSYGGTWNYEIPARESVIHLGDHTLDPIGLAEKFYDTDNFDAVNLRQLVYQAERAIETSTEFPIFTDYVDSTSGLGGEALEVALGELWVGYRFALDDTVLQDVSAALQLMEESTDFVTFTLPSRYVPDQLGAGVDGGYDEQLRVPMAYVRNSGEFLVLPSRKHFARFLEIADVELSRETGQRVANWVNDLFRPGWTVVTDNDIARECANRGITNLSLPEFGHTDGVTVFELAAVDSAGSPRRIQLHHQPDDVPPYRAAVSTG